MVGRMGVSKFYVFDHNSSKPILESISKYVLSGAVEYFYTDFRWAADKSPQLVAYDTCLTKYGALHKFIAFIDYDEFIVVVDKTKKIPDVLRDYEVYGGVALNWMFFGSSGHLIKPAGGVIANYYKCAKNYHIKTIANTQNTDGPGNGPHSFRYKKGYYAVAADANHTRVDGPFNRNGNAFNIMYINHYQTHSLTEYLGKLRRGRNAMLNPKNLTFEYFNMFNLGCKDDCPILQMPHESS